MLYYTISKRRDSIEAQRLLALPLGSPLAATVRSVRLGYAWSKAAERVDQRREIAYLQKQIKAWRSLSAPPRMGSKAQHQDSHAKTTVKVRLQTSSTNCSNSTTVVKKSKTRTPKKPTNNEESKITQHEMSCCHRALLYKICRDEGTTLTADCFTLGTSICSFFCLCAKKKLHLYNSHEESAWSRER